MKNFVQQGDNLTLPSPYARQSGQGALIGAIFGVASVDVAQNTEASFVTRGVFDLPKAAGAVTVGQKLYWDDAAKVVTTTVGSNVAIGFAVKAASSADAMARVKLAQAV